MRGVDGHDIADEVQVSEGHPGLQRVDADAPVRPEHVVHIKLIHPLFGLRLEGGGGGSEVGVLIAEELIRDLAGEQDPDVRGLVDGPAHQVHADAGPDGGDVIGAQGGHHLRQRLNHIVPGDDDLRVVGAQVIRHLTGVLEIDGVHIHADGKGADGLTQGVGGDGAHQAGVQTAGEQEAQRRVGVQPLFHSGDELFPDGMADCVQTVVAVSGDGGQIGVADELAVGIVVAGREGAAPGRTDPPGSWPRWQRRWHQLWS